MYIRTYKTPRYPCLSIFLFLLPFWLSLCLFSLVLPPVLSPIFFVFCWLEIRILPLFLFFLVSSDHSVSIFFLLLNQNPSVSSLSRSFLPVFSRVRPRRHRSLSRKCSGFLFHSPTTSSSSSSSSCPAFFSLPFSSSFLGYFSAPRQCFGSSFFLLQHYAAIFFFSFSVGLLFFFRTFAFG